MTNPFEPGALGPAFLLLGLILMLPGGAKVLGMLLRAVWVGTFGLAGWLLGELYWHAWQKPRLTRAMWQHEFAARGFWGRGFRERSGISERVWQRYGPKPDYLDVEWTTVHEAAVRTMRRSGPSTGSVRAEAVRRELRSRHPR